MIPRPDTVRKLKEKKTEFWQGERHITFEDMSMLLPIEACCVGMSLEFEQPRYDPDPVYLRDNRRNVIHVWEDYIPSLSEIREVSMKFLNR